jgi:hypothetical protein
MTAVLAEFRPMAESEWNSVAKIDLKSIDQVMQLSNRMCPARMHRITYF